MLSIYLRCGCAGQRAPPFVSPPVLETVEEERGPRGRILTTINLQSPRNWRSLAPSSLVSSAILVSEDCFASDLRHCDVVPLGHLQAAVPKELFPNPPVTNGREPDCDPLARSSWPDVTAASALQHQSPVTFSGLAQGS